MLNIGLGELLLVIIIGICVLKPEQLYTTAKMFGTIWGKTHRQINKIKQEISNIQPPL